MTPEISSNVAADMSELVGETPLVHLESFAPNLVAKVESFNPMGSVKDRIAIAMLEQAADDGLLGDETTIIEPTSGNTGVGLAFASAAKGHDLILTMPESMSEERRSLLRALGATLELTDADDGMQGAIDRAEELADERHDTFIPQQFQNEANPRIHRETTGPEIWQATEGQVDVFVAGIGTGGTITGVSRYLKEDREVDSFTSIGVEPTESAVLSGEEAGSHGIQGIGAGFVPDVLDVDVLDEVRTVGTDQARQTTRTLAKETGILTGISSGAAVHVASAVANDSAHEDDLVVTLLPDTGERYLSTDLFE
ncbi:MAG: cysteine synthase A [Halodesulfurarchaeum sp.]